MTPSPRLATTRLVAALAIRPGESCASTTAKPSTKSGPCRAPSACCTSARGERRASTTRSTAPASTSTSTAPPIRRAPRTAAPRRSCSSSRPPQPPVELPPASPPAIAAPSPCPTARPRPRSGHAATAIAGPSARCWPTRWRPADTTPSCSGWTRSAGRPSRPTAATRPPWRVTGWLPNRAQQPGRVVCYLGRTTRGCARIAEAVGAGPSHWICLPIAGQDGDSGAPVFTPPNADGEAGAAGIVTGDRPRPARGLESTPSSATSPSSRYCGPSERRSPPKRSTPDPNGGPSTPRRRATAGAVSEPHVAG